MLAAFGVVALLLCWLVAVPILLFVGVRDRLKSRAQDAASGSSKRFLGFLNVGIAVALGMVPFAAAKLGEVSTGWTDPDGDGMPTGFVMGSYDWGDYVLPSAVLWAIGLIVILVAVWWLLRRRWL